MKHSGRIMTHLCILPYYIRNGLWIERFVIILNTVATLIRQRIKQGVWWMIYVGIRPNNVGNVLWIEGTTHPTRDWNFCNRMEQRRGAMTQLSVRPHRIGLWLFPFTLIKAHGLMAAGKSGMVSSWENREERPYDISFLKSVLRPSSSSHYNKIGLLTKGLWLMIVGQV